MDKTKNNPAQIIWNMDRAELAVLNKIRALAEGGKQSKDLWMKSVKKVMGGWSELPYDVYNDIYVNLEDEAWYMLKLAILNLLSKMGYDQFKDSAYYMIQDMDLSKKFNK